MPTLHRNVFLMKVNREDRERYDIPHVDEIQKQKIEKEQENERQVFVNKVKQR